MFACSTLCIMGYYGAGVFGLIGCISLSPSLALLTFFNNNNNICLTNDLFVVCMPLQSSACCRLYCRASRGVILMTTFFIVCMPLQSSACCRLYCNASRGVILMTSLFCVCPTVQRLLQTLLQGFSGCHTNDLSVVCMPYSPAPAADFTAGLLRGFRLVWDQTG